jgi:hypothetical protein
MPETDELRIFEADPRRVVSVTVEELQKVYYAGWATAHGEYECPVAIHERTCHTNGAPDPYTTHVVTRFNPSGGTFSCAWPYIRCDICRADIPSGSKFCPNCGSTVVE